MRFSWDKNWNIVINYRSNHKKFIQVSFFIYSIPIRNSIKKNSSSRKCINNICRWNNTTIVPFYSRYDYDED